MSATAERLLQEVLQLPEKERLDLIERVYESIEVGNDDGSKVDLGAEWDEEIRRRIEGIENGTAKTISTEELLASFGSGDESDYDPGYVEELRRRIEAHESGRTKGMPYSEARKIIFAEGEDDAAP